MSKVSWPVYADVETWCTNSGINVPASGFVNDLIEATIEEVNEYVGYTFLAATGTVTYHFPSNQVLYLNEYLSNITVTVNGDTVDSDRYDLINGREIHFKFLDYGFVVITGTIGYSTIPTYAWQAVLDYIGYKIITLNPTKNFKTLKQLDADITFFEMRDVPQRFSEVFFRFKY
jgi:hypothetical protein